MTSPETPAPDATLPSLDTVRSELREQCSHYGMTKERLKFAGTILGLPIVLLEHRKRRFDPDDLPLAAYLTIECAVDRFASFEYHRILRYALNLEQLTGDQLGTRQELARKELSLGRTQYERVEEHAFVELAASLLALNQSPCDPIAQAELQRNWSIEHVVTVQIVGVDQLADLLAVLQRDTRTTVREIVARAIALTYVPTGLEVARRFTGTSSMSVSAEPDPAMRIEQGGGNRFAEPVLAMIEGVVDHYLDDVRRKVEFFRPRRPDSPKPSRPLLGEEPLAAAEVEWARQQRTLTAEDIEERAEVRRIVADLLVQTEVSDRWLQVLEPPASSELNVLV